MTTEAERLAKVDVTRGEHELVEQALAKFARTSTRLLAALVVVFAVSAGTTVYLLHKSNAERNARVQTVSQILQSGCATDNGQDKLLARLVAASLSQQGGSFGEGIDPSTLTPFDLQVLATIAKVSAATQTPLTDKFRHVLHKLRNLTDCSAVVQAYLNGDPLSSVTR